MENEVEISLIDVISILWNKVLYIILAIIIGGGIAFGVSNFMIDPTYSSSTSMYVNNNTDRVDSYLNINDINASQKLVPTYIEILKSDIVLDEVIKKMELSYTNEELEKMITANALNNTEILEVKVTSKNPNEAADIANMLCEVAPSEIIRVVKAGGVQIIDVAIPKDKPVAPNVKMITVLGAFIAGLITCFIVIIINMLDNRVKSDEDLRNQYEIPVLGVIPHIL